LNSGIAHMQNNQRPRAVSDGSRNGSPRFGMFFASSIGVVSEWAV
jgi:hypothetical protein